MTDLTFYRGKRVFVTGHTGFKGSWLCHTLIRAGAQVTGYSLPPPTSPSLFALCGLAGQMTSVMGDVRDFTHLKQVFDTARPQLVLHLAAQPIVRTGYEQPRQTFETNVMGTVNLLECVRTARQPVGSVVNITTDKVYQNHEWCWAYRENEPLDGYDPYSNSKSCSELVTHSYRRSFFGPGKAAVSTARAGNVIGGGDFARDRILPDCVRAALSGQTIRVRCPQAIRPFQHVLEPVMAYLMIAQRQYGQPQLAGCYNVGPDSCDCVTTGQLVELFCRCWGQGASWQPCPESDAPHEAGLLKLDCTLLKSTFGWRPRWHIGQAVEKAVEWSRAWQQGQDVAAVMDRQLQEFGGSEYGPLEQ